VKNDFQYLWDIPAETKHLGPSVTHQLVEYAESQWGVVLPESYVELVKVQNGGYTSKVLPGSVHSQIWGIPPIEGDWDGRTLYNIVSSFADPVEFGLSDDARFVITLDGDGHWYLCMDYRNTEGRHDPRIVMIDVESGYEETSVIAPSFEEYLDLLVYDAGRAYLFLTAEKPENVVERLCGNYQFDFVFSSEEYDTWRVKDWKPGPRIASNTANLFKETDYRNKPPTTRVWGAKRARYQQIPESGTEISWIDEDGSQFSIEQLRSLFPDLIALYEGKN